MALSSDKVASLYDDPQGCAEAAGLRYVAVDDEPGIRRVRRGQGFSYRQSGGKAVGAAVRKRIEALVIPPAWQDVWICRGADGHIQAVGTDDRGRRQYLYHQRWREVRDLLNFCRLLSVGEQLPRIRSHIEAELRRRTVDRDLVLAAMLRIVDCCGIRAGSEIYAEENDSFGLSTLSRRHVTVSGKRVRLDFPAKSGQRAEVVIDDAAVARVVRHLAARPGRRLFSVDGASLGADEVNDELARLADARVTLKDFRTWRGTRVAFADLCEHLDAEDREAAVVAAVDAAAEQLGNTRAVARAHYVHPVVVEGYLDGGLKRFVSRWHGRTREGLDRDETVLLAYLEKAMTDPLAAMRSRR
ncbi:MAG TPA: DNA topoisomerase IB [Mycobacteriales bacterium]|nr:DNA topoisomerase IB [Mycobacteriales bacterium]